MNWMKASAVSLFRKTPDIQFQTDNLRSKLQLNMVINDMEKGIRDQISTGVEISCHETSSSIVFHFLEDPAPSCGRMAFSDNHFTIFDYPGENW
jgi:hypothetical protein